MRFHIFNFHFSELQQLRNKYAIYILCLAFVTVSICTSHKNKVNGGPTWVNMPAVGLSTQRSHRSDPPNCFAIALHEPNHKRNEQCKAKTKISYLMTKITIKLIGAVKNGATPTKNPETPKSKIHFKDSKRQRLSKKSPKTIQLNA
jgi:hypothetical protein